MLYANRTRAESFGEDARLYHRVRPRYPAALLDHLLAGATPSVLDVGCGTGIAAQLLMARGCTVLGVEPDERMAALARENGVEVEVGRFEDWDARGRTFELVTSGQAWHWVQPDPGLARAADVLRDGGRIALFWNFAQADEPVAGALTDLYARLAPELGDPSMMLGGNRRAHDPIIEALRACDRFADPDVREWTWRHAYSAADWVAQARTQSTHRSLPQPRRTELLDAVQATIDALGGVVEVGYMTRLIEARRS